MAFLSKIFRAKQPQEDSRKGQPTPAPSRPSPATVAVAELAGFILSETDTGRCLEALSRLTDEQQRLPLAMKHPVAAVRMAAAEGIHSLSALQQLQTQAKSKDKAVYRLCKERLQQQKDLQQQQQARQERLEQLLAQARYLNKVGYHPEFNGKLQLLHKEWPELQQHAAEELRQALNNELQAADQLLQQHAEEEARRAAEAAAQAAARQQQQQLLQDATALLNDAGQCDSQQLHTRLQHLQQQWDAAFRQQQPDSNDGRRFEQLLQHLLTAHSVLHRYAEQQQALNDWLAQTSADARQLQQGERFLQGLQWPAGSEQPAWYQQLNARLQQLREQAQHQHQQQQSRVQQLEQQLHTLEQHLSNGLIKDAGKLSQQLHNSLRQLDERSAAPLQRRLRGLNNRLHDMRDWAGFATAPKKEALLASMEALIGAELSPDVLADRVHALQEEWKTLSGAATDHELWERFRAAADQAFEPCKAWFAGQAEQRSRFAVLRQQLIAELDRYEQAMDWAQADWKAVQKTLDTARATFRRYAPVERGLHKETQDAFNHVCDRIYAHLKAEYDRNLARKQALTDAARTLAESGELQGIADQIKQLQNQWKTIGVTPRGPDQKLWQQFRKHCDAVFTQLDAQRAVRKAELSEVVDRADTLIRDTLENLASEPAAAAQQLQAVRQQLQQLHLPKAAQQRLLRQLQDASDRLQEQQQQQQQAAQRERLAGLMARLQHLQGSDSDWQQACALPLPPQYAASDFEQARAAHQNGSLSANGDARDLCILMEILAEQSTPDHDKNRRMELQVQRLAEGLGKALTAEEERQQLIGRWLTVAATPEESARFIGALTAL